MWFGGGEDEKGTYKMHLIGYGSRGCPISIHFCRMVFWHYGALKLVFVEEGEVHLKIAHGSYSRTLIM